MFDINKMQTGFNVKVHETTEADFEMTFNTSSTAHSINDQTWYLF